jgi:hypothetical protein
MSGPRAQHRLRHERWLSGYPAKDRRATNRVTRVEGGVHQNFMGPDGQSAIFATEPDRALVLNAKYHEAYRLIGGGDGMVSVGRAGYPLDEGTEVAGGQPTDRRRWRIRD